MEPQQLIAEIKALIAKIDDNADYEQLAEDLRLAIFGLRQKFRLFNEQEQWLVDLATRNRAIWQSAPVVVKNATLSDEHLRLLKDLNDKWEATTEKFKSED